MNQAQFMKLRNRYMKMNKQHESKKNQANLMQDLDRNLLVLLNHEHQSSLKMEHDTKENGWKEQMKEKVMAYKYGVMDLNMKDGGQITKQMDEGD